MAKYFHRVLLSLDTDEISYWLFRRGTNDDQYKYNFFSIPRTLQLSF